MSKKPTDYILGTDEQELIRLGVQHQIWAGEAAHGWAKAGFSAGMTLLDLGSGPGYCSRELAFITGREGKVIAVDKSAAFIDHLDRLAKLQHLNIESIASNFNDLQLMPNAIDGMYCRWALAWLPNPEAILQKVLNALKPGGKMVIHEYYDWSTHQIQPSKPALTKAIGAALQSFKDSEGEIDIGRLLPGMLSAMGMKVTGIRPMAKLARPESLNWQWPKTFYYSYFPRLVAANYLSEKEMKLAFNDLKALEDAPGATLCCPLMVEVIAEKHY
jgi:ubiquinone/menaquinone biosynthesis C-methylase UbiE